MIRVSRHAILRYQERVRPCCAAEARSDILSHGRALEAAVMLGAKVVRLGDGSRLLLNGSTITTVLAKYMSAAGAA